MVVSSTSGASKRARAACAAVRSPSTRMIVGGSPSRARRTLAPAATRSRDKASPVAPGGASSTTETSAGSVLARSGCPNGRRSVSSKVDPTPTSERTSICPPMWRARRCAMARPSPVPTRRVGELRPPCTNGLNTCWSCAGAMPGPVSRTRTVRRAWSSSATTEACTSTSPRSVNFTALATRFSAIWRMRCASPMSAHSRSCSANGECSPGPAASTSTHRSMAFRCAASATTPVTSSSSSRSANSRGASSTCSASIFEKSSTSETSAKSHCPDARAMSTKVRCSAVSEVSAKNSAMPNTPLSGVRISWLIVAKKSAFARDASSASSFADCSASRALTTSVTSCSVPS